MRIDEHGSKSTGFFLWVTKTIITKSPQIQSGAGAEPGLICWAPCPPNLTRARAGIRRLLREGRACGGEVVGECFCTCVLNDDLQHLHVPTETGRSSLVRLLRMHFGLCFSRRLVFSPGRRKHAEAPSTISCYHLLRHRPHQERGQGLGDPVSTSKARQPVHAMPSSTLCRERRQEIIFSTSYISRCMLPQT